MPKVKCEKCGKPLKVAERRLGELVKCPGCGEMTMLELPNEIGSRDGVIRDEQVKPKAEDRQVQRLQKSVRNRTVTMIAMLVIFVSVVAAMASQVGDEPKVDEALSDKIANLEAENSKLQDERQKIKENTAVIKTLVARILELEKKANAWSKVRKDPEFNTITARQLSIVDGKGRKRIVILNEEKSGDSILGFFDDKGEGRYSLKINGEGTFQQLRSPDGKSMISTEVLTDTKDSGILFYIAVEGGMKVSVVLSSDGLSKSRR